MFSWGQQGVVMGTLKEENSINWQDFNLCSVFITVLHFAPPVCLCLVLLLCLLACFDNVALLDVPKTNKTTRKQKVGVGVAEGDAEVSSLGGTFP